MDEKTMIFCKNCRWYWATECSVSEAFISPIFDNALISDAHYRPPLKIRNESGVKMCQHRDCFCIKTYISIEYGPEEIKGRIAGQAQHNKDCNCSRYKPNRLHRFIRLFTKEK